MSGSLVKLDEEIVTSAVASVTLTGIDSTYDVYMVRVNNWETQIDARTPYMRFTVSGTDDTSANYDRAFKFLDATTTFANGASVNQTQIQLSANIGTAGNETLNGIFYLFNFANSSEYSFVTGEMTSRTSGTALFGGQGGAVLTVAQATDGVTFFLSSSANTLGGTFTLYGLKK